MEWKYYAPVFECDEYNRDMLRFSPWSGHRRFAYDLVANLQPKTIVELGSFYGCSTFAFAQAVKDLNLKTIIWGVDLWDVFDEFTKDDYREDVYGAFCNVLGACFDERYVRKLRMTFDQALEQFAPKSIDVLHIDGSHYYEDVKHDFTVWREKLSENAIVLFHDIAEEKINGEIMGSHIFWEEIKTKEKYTMQFDFSCGLGILFASEDAYRKVKESMNPVHYQDLAESEAVQVKDAIRKMSFKLKGDEKYIQNLKEQLAVKDYHLNRYKTDTDNLKRDYERTIKTKDRYIADLERQNCESEQKLKNSYEKTIAEKDKYIAKLEEQIPRIEEDLKQDYGQTILQKDQYIDELMGELQSAGNEVAEDYKKTIIKKDDYIASLENRIVQMESDLKQDYEQTILQKDKYIEELADTLQRSAQEAAGEKEETVRKYLAEIEKIKQDYQRTIDGKDSYIAELEEKLNHTQEKLT